ncbi:MAG: T9SS type A sorting domain-containing protein [Bacteroidetes bacterium]|jgi:hypothetical protein|nr:T9SS type A sorting domain-containing protein [Bacteroidota bacterium]
MKKQNVIMSVIKRCLITLTLVPVLNGQVMAQCPPLGHYTGMTGDFGACPGMSLSYTINPVTNATSYTWQLPPGATISGMNPYTSASTTVTVNYGPSFSAPGNICVVASNGCSSLGSYCKSLSPAGSPSGASQISGSIFACPGQTLTYSVNNYVNRVFDWKMPANATILSGQGTNVISVKFNNGFSGGDICVRVGNGCVYSGYRCMSVYASSPSTPIAVTGPVVLCGGQTGTFSTGFGGNAPVTSFTWSAPVGSVITGQGDSIVQIKMPANYSSGNVIVVANNNCGSSGQRGLKVREIPAVPAPISGLAAGICSGTTSYSIQTDPTAVSYNWTLTGPGSISNGQGTNAINITYPMNFVSGKICVSITNACGTSGSRCLATSKDIIITGQPQHFETCSGTNAHFTVYADGINLQYQWRKNGVALTNGGKISGALTDSLVITGADSLDAGSYDVVVSNLCNSQVTSSAKNLVIKEVPSKPGIISGVQSVTCPGTTGIVYSIPLQPDATGYTWGYTNGVQILNGQGTNTVTLQFDSTINSGYSVYVFATNGCGSSIDSATSWTRYSISSPVISGQKRVCDKLPGIVYSSQLIAGANSYNWNVPAGATLVSGQGTNSITVDFGPSYTGGDITVTASNICFTTPVKKLTTVIDVPGVPTSLTGTNFGACNTQLSYTAGNSNYATSYTWTLPPNSSISSGAGTNSVTVGFLNPGSGSYNMCVAGTNYCRTGNTRCITVRAVPQRPSAITADPTVFCMGQQGVRFATAGGLGASSYQWIAPSGTVITAGQGTNNIVANMGNANGIVGVTSSNTCGNSGTTTYSAVMNCREAGEELPLENLQSLTLSPNPATTAVQISFNTEKSSTYKINVYDILGKSRFAEGGISKAGVNNHNLNIATLSSGVYIIEVKTDDYSIKRKLEVR